MKIKLNGSKMTIEQDTNPMSRKVTTNDFEDPQQIW